jgi:hypothetical protein
LRRDRRLSILLAGEVDQQWGRFLVTEATLSRYFCRRLLPVGACPPSRQPGKILAGVFLSQGHGVRNRLPDEPPKPSRARKAAPAPKSFACRNVRDRIPLSIGKVPWEHRTGDQLPICGRLSVRPQLVPGRDSAYGGSLRLIS